MRPEGNPLDLNNLPAEDHYTSCRGGKLNPEEYSSSSAGKSGFEGAGTEEEEEQVLYCSRERGKKSGSGGGGGGDGKDVEELGVANNNNKVYECRFCSLKFCKSQALGGHMNRHRQERETESLNKARQLVLSNDLAPAHLSYVSSGQPFHHHHPTSNMGEPSSLSFRSMYHPAAARLFPNSSVPFNIPPPPPPPQAAGGPYMYTSPPRILSFPTPHPNDYFLGHVISPNTPQATGNNYTCIGAPVGHRFAGLEEAGGADLPMQNQEAGDRMGQ